MAEDQDSEIQEEVVLESDDGLDSLAGQELFEVPDDLLDDEPAGAPAATAETDPAQAKPGEPPAKKPATEQPRDPVTQRFREKPKDELATDEGQPPETTPPGESTAAVPAAEEAEPEPELEFSFRADGRSIPIKGSKVTADGVYIPKEYMGDVQRLMSHGVVYQGSYKQRLQESAQREAEAKATVNQEAEQGKKLMAFWADMADRQASGEMDEQGRTPVEAWIENFIQNRVKLEAEMELAAAKAYRERQAEPVKIEGFDDEPAQQPEIDLEELSQALSPQMEPRLLAMMKAEGIRGLTGAEITRIRDFMVEPRNLPRFFMRAEQDIPAAEWGGPHDIKAGQTVAMDAEIRAELKYQAGLILDARRGAAELEAAKQKNQRTNGNRIPPVTPVAGNGVPRGSKIPPKFKSKEEMEAWFNAEDPLS